MTLASLQWPLLAWRLLLFTPSDCPRSGGCWAGPGPASWAIGPSLTFSGFPVLVSIPQWLSSFHSGRSFPLSILLSGIVCSRSLLCFTSRCSQVSEPVPLVLMLAQECAHTQLFLLGCVHLCMCVYSSLFSSIFFTWSPSFCPFDFVKIFLASGRECKSTVLEEFVIVHHGSQGF